MAQHLRLKFENRIQKNGEQFIEIQFLSYNTNLDTNAKRIDWGFYQALFCFIPAYEDLNSGTVVSSVLKICKNNKNSRQQCMQMDIHVILKCKSHTTI